MKYTYYPGCSLEGTAREYNRSTRAIMAALDIQLTELTGWSCCGASAAEGTSRLLSYALPAINLAIAEGMDADADLLVPCSACYLNLKRVSETVIPAPALLARVNTVIGEKGLAVAGKVKPRHLLDVLSRDIGGDAIASRATRKLSGLTVAPYYGCQCLRPYPVFDDPERPASMEPLIRASGASVHSWGMGARCCGASHMNTKMDVALDLVRRILEDARGADAIVTVCPMCQMNLEAYQDKIADVYKENLSITILYLPQLLGLAMGLPEADLGLGDNLRITHPFTYKLKRNLSAAA